ncbi:MAG: hypothetical protein ACLFTO_02105 [Candidatus Acetothermia bacterium]
MENHKKNLVVGFFIVFVFFLVLSISVGEVEALTVQTGSFRIDLGGEKTWTVEGGIGDGGSLSEVGYPKDSYSLSQTLKVDLSGEIGEVFSLSANLDDTEPGYLQEFELRMDTDNWDGLAGNIVAGDGDNFTVYNKKLLGLELDGALDGAGVRAIAGRLQGISETKVFRGDTGESEVEYSLYRTDAGLEETGYDESIRGLQYYELDVEYVEGFTTPEAEFRTGAGLVEFLQGWELGYLEEVITEEPEKELDSDRFTVISEEQDYLLLLEEVNTLSRSWVKDYISAYNQNLPEEEQEEYPFNRGTDLEEEFLEALKSYIRLTVGDDELEIDDYSQERFYFLGQTGVNRDGFELQVRQDGDWTSVDGLTGYGYDLFAGKGVFEVDFPDEFFSDLEGAGMRASFQYEISGKTYMLGFSVAPDSEEVYLNGELLTKDTDYSIDYETGALILFRELGPDDELKVDFERARDGLGGFAQFGRTLYGFSTSLESDYGLTADVHLFQARDSAPAELPPEVSTMPNVHSVVGVGANYQKNGWNLGLRFGGNLNRFPFDDNERVHLPNQINGVISLEDAGYEEILFLHDNGFTARRPDSWESFGTNDGLSADKVNEGLVVDGKLYLATVGGLTSVDLTGTSPFGRSDNWESYYESDGLPETELLSLASDDGRIWVGTSSGVFRFETGELGEDDPWNEIDLGELDEAAIETVSFVEEHLWLGTKDGLYLFDLEEEELVGEGPVIDSVVEDALVSDGKLLVGTPEGMTRVGVDAEEERLVEGEAVRSISTRNGEIWFGTDRGFKKVDETASYGKERVTALLVTGESIWAGSRGRNLDDDTELTVYQLAEGLNRYGVEETGIEGIDENRYRSIDPGSHTDRGIFLSGEAKKDLDVWSREVSFSSDFEYYQPTYTAIGRRERKDKLSTGVRVEAEVTDNFSLGLGTEYSVSSLSTGFEDWTVTNRISGYWKALVDGSAEFTWDTGGKGRTDLGLVLGLDKTFWNENLTTALNVTADRRLSSSGSTTDSVTLASRFSVSPWGTGNIGLDYTYPLTFGSLEKAESEKLTWNFDFSRDFPINPDYAVNFSLDGEGNLDKPSLEGFNSSDSKVGIELTPGELSVQDLDLSPSVSFSWEGDSSSNQLSGKLDGEVLLGNFSSNTSLSRNVRYPIGSRLVEYEDKVQAGVSYEFEEMTPDVSFRLSRNLLTHPDFGRKTKYSSNLSLGTRWELAPGLNNRLKTGVSYKAEDGWSYNLEDSLSWKINSKLSPELDFGLDYFPGSGEVDVNTETEFSYPFRDRWGVSFVSGVNVGFDDSGELYSSYYGSAGLMVEF